MELQDQYAEIEAIGAEIIAVSIDSEEDARAVVARLNLTYPVLYDTTTAVTRAWGVFNLLNDGVPAPAVYVFDSAGNLVSYRIGETIADRPHAAEVLSVLAAS